MRTSADAGTAARHRCCVSDYGKMRYEWKTTYDDAVQNKPYWFKFKIQNHGHSNPVQVWVIFGE
jgi:hypothetical protein